jgi:tRNA dimethylallyltransferase
LKSTNKYLIVVAGPTAIGKTAVAIKIAQHFSTEILSADSRQFYKELNIGVARPSIAELATIKHHFIGHISINDTYTAGDFEKAALNKLEQLFQKHDIVVLAGGSGLFINALLNGLDNLPRDEKIRETLNTRQVNEGIEALAKQLKTLDIDEYNSISLSNPRRIIRSLEICLASGEKASTLKKQNTLPRNFSPIKIALNTDRQLLYTKINNRVDIMLKNGLIDEVQHLLPYKHLNALQTVGYKELFEYFEGELDLEKAIELIKQHTRNYAKRQLTWFRKDDSYKWFEPQQLQDIVSYCKTLIQ